MTLHQSLLPGIVAPDLAVSLVGGGTWSLQDQVGGSFVLIDFYRGLHCPRCNLHVLDIKSKLARFFDRGVKVLALSMDSRERAEATHAKWGLEGLDLGYGLTENQARTWGLYLTHSINEKEPRLFNEPGLVMVRTGSFEIYSAVYGTNPFNRVHASDILEGIDAILARDYPARGGVA